MSFQMRELGLALAMTLAIIAAGGWVVWRLYRSHVELVRTDLRVRALAGEIMRLDEVLTMSARLAAATGQLRWEVRYLQHEPRLAAALAEARTLAPDAYQTSSTAATEAANQALVRMERDAFALVRDRRPDEAARILFSDAYERHKQVYADGMTQTLQAIERREAAQLASHRAHITWVGVAALAVLAVFVVCWIRLLVTIRRQLEVRESGAVAA